MKKGQAAMEYLMTYGWAILIVVVVVAALYAMGVFKPRGTTVPCSPCFSYFAYVDYDGTTLVLTNGPREINITSFTSTGGTVTVTDPGAVPVVVTPGATIKATVPAGDVTITYVDQTSGLTHTDTATLRTP